MSFIKKIYTSIFTTIVLANLLSIFNVNTFYIKDLISFIFLCIIPGGLILSLFNFRNTIFHYFVHSIGMSLFSLMSIGLIINYLLYPFGIHNPLSFYPFLISYDIFIFILLALSYKANSKKSIVLNMAKPRISTVVFTLLPVFILVLSVIGTVFINNAGYNYITILSLILIAIYFIVITYYHRLINKNIFPYSILITSLSLLLIYSLRTERILGWDINLEFEVFKMTQSGYYWNPLNFPNNPYNASLSITVLPTIFSNFFSTTHEYIYKLYFQILFAFFPLGIYLFLRNFTTSLLSYISTFFVISQIWFYHQMPALIRQEVGLIFFILMLLVAFEKNISTRVKNILFFVYGIGIILSHYSTSYVTLGLFTLVLVITFIIRNISIGKVFEKRLSRVNLLKNNNISYLISYKLIIALLIISYTWSAIFTQSASNLSSVINNISNNLNIKSYESFLPTTINQFVYTNYKVNSEVELKEYIGELKTTYKLQHPYLEFYPQSTNSEYVPAIVDADKIPIKVNTYIYEIVAFFDNVIKIILNNILILFGIALLLFSRKFNKYDDRYIILSISSLFIISSMFLIPTLHKDYNITRLYIQLLSVLSLAAVLSIYFIASKYINNKLSTLIVSIIFALFFLYSYKIPFQFTGGSPSIILNNYGHDYDMYNITTGETYSAKWLNINKSNDEIYTDRISALRLKSYGMINDTYSDIHPVTISKNSYVYLGDLNTQNKIIIIKQNSTIIYNYPTKFVDTNKNLIYNNTSSKIYK